METDTIETETDETGGISWPALKKKEISHISHMDREQVLELASDLINYLHTRSCGPRFREYPTDKTRATYQRVMVAAISAYGVLLRDAELDELKRRIDVLEMVKGNGNDEK